MDRSPTENGTRIPSLVEQAKEGNLDAFDCLVYEFREPVTKLVRSIVESKEMQADVVQDVFLTVFKALPSLESPESFEPWLNTIARHRAKRVGASESRTKPQELSELDRLLISKSRELATITNHELEDRLEAKQLINEMESLPENIAAPALMHYGEGESVSTIAKRLNISPSAVKWRLGEARQRVRQKLTTSEEL